MKINPVILEALHEYRWTSICYIIRETKGITNATVVTRTAMVSKVTMITV
jgi:hypothetical protein